MFSLFGLLALSAGISYGQAVDGNIVGTVVDSQGAVVVGAEVSTTNLATNAVATTKTNDTGEYRFDHLPAGTYRVTATMTGFKTIGEMVTVELNKTGTRNLTLTPGATSETVEVSGVLPVLDTTSAQIQTTFSAKELADLPAASTGSGIINLSLLNAGVASSGGVGLGSGPSISGQRPRNNNYTVEGVDNNSKAVTGPNFTIPNDAVEQFTILQNQFSPEFGHSSGGQFNQTIKSGSNTFHGRAYEYFQNRKLNAIDSLVATSEISQGLKPFNTRYDNNRFGGQIGGPIIKNKLFFFTNWEYQPQGTVSSSTGCGPTAAGYTQLTAGVGSPSLGMVSATNLAQFQQGAGTALKQAALDNSDPYCPAWASGFGDGLGGTGSVAIGDIGYSGANYYNNMTGVMSMDWNISDKDQLRGRYAYNKYDGNDATAQIPSFWTIIPVRNHLFTLSEYHTFTPNLNNEVRIGFNRSTNTYPDGNFKFPGLDSYPNLYVGIGESYGVQLGADPNAPQFGAQNFYQVVDNIGWVKGSHNFKFGGEYREYISPQGFTQRKRGDYDYLTFRGYFTDQVPDYLGERSIGSVTYYGNQNMFYGYANDDWHIAKNFSINLGVRYEFTQVPLSEKTWQVQNAISNVPGLITFAAPAQQKKNFLPRIGFAWSPGSSGNTSIRGGYSMALDVLYDNLGLLSASPQVQQTCDAYPSDQSTMNAGCYWSDPTLPASGGGGNQPGFLQAGGLPFATTIPPITDPAYARSVTAGYIPDQKLPYSETWTLGIQHIFAQKYTLEVRYVGTRGIHLPVQQRINRQDKTSATEFLPEYFTAPDQGTLDSLATTYAQIDANSSFVPAYAAAGFNGASVVGFNPYGSSKYHGLQTQLRRSFTNGLSLQAAWTWSHAMDNSTADVFSTYLTPRRPQNFQCWSCEWSDSALDRRHRITVGVLYDLPFYKKADSWLMKNVVGNWQLSPVYTFQSPEYATVQSGLDVNGNGDSAGDRTFINPAGVKGTGTGSTPLCTSSLPGERTCGVIDIVGGVPQPDDSSQWLVGYAAKSSTAQYVVAGKFTRPNAGRNTLAMPHTNNFDFAVVKRFNFTERQSFEFQAQFSNVFNHAQYLPGYISDVAPLGYTGSDVLAMLIPSQGGFNKPQSVFSNHPRQTVLVLKYTF